MRHVQVNSNHDLLKEYSNKIVLPFFDFIIEIKRSGDFNVRKFSPLKRILRLLPANYPIEIFETINDDVIMIALIDELIKTSSLAEIEIEKINYNLQNDALNSGTNPPEFVRNESLYKIFSKLFFEVLFDSDECWNYIKAGLKFDRKLFFKNYRETNNGICPLCDIETVIEKSDSVVEHFFPRNNYPYLSLNGFNLIATCNACNKAEEGKGSRIYAPIALPYYTCVGDNIKFDFSSIPSNHIEFIPPTSDIEIENFEKTIKLKARYRKDTTAIVGIQKLRSDFSIIEKFISTKSMSPKEAFEFYMDKQYHDNFYYFRKNYLSAFYK